MMFFFKHTSTMGAPEVKSMRDVRTLTLAKKLRKDVFARVPQGDPNVNKNTTPFLRV